MRLIAGSQYSQSARAMPRGCLEISQGRRNPNRGQGRVRSMNASRSAVTPRRVFDRLGERIPFARHFAGGDRSQIDPLEDGTFAALKKLPADMRATTAAAADALCRRAYRLRFTVPCSHPESSLFALLRVVGSFLPPPGRGRFELATTVGTLADRFALSRHA